MLLPLCGRCTSMAQRTASTTLRNSIRTPSPVRLTAMMHGDGGIDQIAPQPVQSRQGSILVGTGKLAVSGHVRRKNGRELPGLRHGSPFTIRQTITTDRSRERQAAPNGFRRQRR
jgi:hypothetical protein